MVRSASLGSLALLLLAPALARAADADIPREPGVYWEQSIEMQMAGFSMPAQTSKVCISKKGMEEPPRSAKDNQKCQMTDVKRSGQRMTWKMKCEDGTTGEGDITSGPDAFDGKMTMRTQGQEMNMKMKGKKVGGDCDANELKRQVAGMQKQVETAQADAARKAALDEARRCEEAVDDMKVGMFVPPYPGVPVSCKDPSKLCARLDTREGLLALRQKGGKGAREKAEKLCKKDVGAAIDKHCAAASKEQEKKLGGPSTEFVFAYCPDLAKALAKKECAGRSFTGLPPAQRDFCTRWAQGKLEASDEDEDRPVKKAAKKKAAASDDDDEQPKAKAKKKAETSGDEEEKPKEDMKSKILKGIFGR
jgi:hypothetical protein